MSSYRPGSYADDDDPYASHRNRSPGAAHPPPPHSPDTKRGSSYRPGAGSPSPARYRSSSPRFGGDADPYARDFDRYDRERDRDSFEGRGRYTDDYGRDRERPPPGGSDRYVGGGSRYVENDYYQHALEQDREREAERLGRSEGPIPDPLDSPALLPFKQFAQVHRMRQARLDPGYSASNLTTQEMFDLYKRYKIVYTARSARKFWEEKKEVAFFQEKYGLGETEVERRKERRRKGREGRKKAWLNDLRTGVIDGVNWEMVFASGKGQRGFGEDGMHTVFSRTGEPLKISNDSLPVGPDPHQLLIMKIPPALSRRSLETELAEYSGYKYLAVGEAHANKHYYAIGWAVFDSESSAQEARSKMLDNPIVGNNRLTLDIALRGAQVKFRSAPSGSGNLKRLAKDLKQAKDLVRIFQKEDNEALWPDGSTLDEEDRTALLTDAGPEIFSRVVTDLGLAAWFSPADGEDEDAALMQIHDGSRVIESEEERQALRNSVKKALDMHMDLLREVWHCDYYSSTICDFAEELSRRARAHFRRVYPNGETEADREGKDTGEEGTNMGEEQWAENLDRKHGLLIGSAAIDIEDHGGVDLEKLCWELATPFTRQDDKEKHRCVVGVPNPSAGEGATKTCDKLFRALIFVQKHVCNKHKDIIEQELGTRREDILYLNNYIRDPTRVMPPLTGFLPPERGAGGRSNGYDGNHHPDAAGGAVLRMGARDYGGDFDDVGGPRGGRGRGGGRRGGGRRSMSPAGRNGDGGARLSDRLGGPTPIHLAPSMAGPPLHLRLGGQQGGVPPLADLSGAPVRAEPLPPPPRPLDPRAAKRDTRSYQDLDTGGGDGQEEVMELEY